MRERELPVGLGAWGNYSMQAESLGVLSRPQVSTPTSPSGLLGEGASLPLRRPINELIHRAEATVLLGQLLTL